SKTYGVLLILAAVSFLGYFWSPDSTFILKKASEVFAIFLLGIAALVAIDKKPNQLNLFSYATIALLLLTFIEVLFQYPISQALGKVDKELSLYLDDTNYMILFLS